MEDRTELTFELVTVGRIAYRRTVMPTGRMRPEDFFDFGEPPKPPITPSPTGPRIKVIHPIPKARQTDPLGHYVDCTSYATEPENKFELSPLYLGPCRLYGGHEARRMENAWQYSKVYAQHVGPDGNPTQEYFSWAAEGWSRSKGQRHPMGKGATPEFFWWDGRKLTRVEARKEIYVPLYAELVVKKNRFRRLRTAWHMLQHAGNGTLYLMDVDAYDCTGMTLTQVLNNAEKSLGHGFVLAMLLTDDPALKECKLRSVTK